MIKIPERQSSKKNESSIKSDSDDGIKYLIAQAFRWCARLRAGRVRFSVKDGTVKLWGSVPSFEEQLKAERAILATPGVKCVENHLKIEH